MNVEPTVPAVDPSDKETARIRSVYHRRDRRGPRHASIEEAYRLINADRVARIRAVVIDALPSSHPSILDVGCGAGSDLAFWMSSGWPTESLAGVDLVEQRVIETRSRCPGVDVRVTSGSTLPFADDTFELATAVVVFSSILDPDMRRALFEEMRRVVRPGGIVLIYDFTVRKPGNHDVIPMDLSRLRALGLPPTFSVRLTGLLQLVALATRFGRFGVHLAMRFAPRTHRLTWWRVSDPPAVLEPVLDPNR